MQILLLRRLGWSRPDLGLRWWYDAGKPTDDPTLRLISEVWDADGSLDIYLVWLLRQKAAFPIDDRFASWNVPSTAATALPESWRRWLEAFERSPRATEYEHFYLGGGTDPLHLSGQQGDSGEADPTAYLRPVDAAARTAVFVSSAADSWYSDLASAGNRLPVHGVASWKVDVFVEPIGFLGTYRRSMQTGSWFTGRHRVHAVGK